MRWHFRCLLLAALLLPSAGTSKPHSRGLLAYTRSLSACLDGGDAIDGALCALQQLGPYLSQAIDTRSDGAASHRKRITHELRGLLQQVEAHWSELKEEKSQPRRLLADITTSARLESLSSACNISTSSKPEVFEGSITAAAAHIAGLSASGRHIAVLLNQTQNLTQQFLMKNNVVVMIDGGGATINLQTNTSQTADPAGWPWAFKISGGARLCLVNLVLDG